MWFDDPAKESVSEETGEEIILIKDNYLSSTDLKDLKKLPIETEILA